MMIEKKHSIHKVNIPIGERHKLWEEAGATTTASCPHCGSMGLDPNTMDTCPDCGKDPDGEDKRTLIHIPEAKDNTFYTDPNHPYRAPEDHDGYGDKIKADERDLAAEIDFLVEALLGEIALGILTTKEVITSLVERLTEETLEAFAFEDDDRQMELVAGQGE